MKYISEVFDKRAYIWGVIGLALMSVLVIVVYSGLQSAKTVQAIRETQNTNTKARENSDEILAIIKSCTTPEGKCAKDSNAATGEFVAGLNDYNKQVIAFTVYCGQSKDDLTLKEIENCVETLLKQ